MTLVSFGVSASSFVAHNLYASSKMSSIMLAATAVDNAFYVDDGITGANSV